MVAYHCLTTYRVDQTSFLSLNLSWITAVTLYETYFKKEKDYYLKQICLEFISKATSIRNMI